MDPAAPLSPSSVELGPLLKLGVEIFHEKGDLLVLMVCKCTGKFCRVSSEALVRFSPYFREILDPSKSRREGVRVAPQIVSESFGALRLVLFAVHGSWQHIPSELILEQLYHVAAVCYRYGMIGLFAGYWSQWTAMLPSPPADDYEAMVQDLVVKYILGRYEPCKRALYNVILETGKTAEGRLFVGGYCLSNNKTVQHLGLCGK